MGKCPVCGVFLGFGCHVGLGLHAIMYRARGQSLKMAVANRMMSIGLDKIYNFALLF